MLVEAGLNRLLQEIEVPNTRHTGMRAPVIAVTPRMKIYHMEKVKCKNKKTNLVGLFEFEKERREVSLEVAAPMKGGEEKSPRKTHRDLILVGVIRDREEVAVTAQVLVMKWSFQEVVRKTEIDLSAKVQALYPALTLNQVATKDGHKKKHL